MLVVVFAGCTEVPRLFLLPPKIGIERPIMDVLAAAEGDGCGITDACRAKNGVVENSDTAACAFFATGLRTSTAGGGAITEAGLLMRGGEGFIGDKRDGTTCSSTAFLLTPPITLIRRSSDRRNCLFSFLAHSCFWISPCRVWFQERSFAFPNLPSLLKLRLWLFRLIGFVLLIGLLAL